METKSTLDISHQEIYKVINFFDVFCSCLYLIYISDCRERLDVRTCRRLGGIFAHPLLNKAYGNCSALTALNPNKGTITTYLGASFHHKILRDMPKKS